MRKFKTILGIAAVFAAVLGFIGCSSDSDDDEPEPKIAVSVAEGATFKVGDEVTNDKLSVTKDEKSINSEEFEILDVVVAEEGESKGNSIKGEDGKFIIPAAGKYTVTIKLTSGGKSASCEITATEKQNGDDNNDDKNNGNDDQNNDNNDNNDNNKTEEDAALTAAKAEKVAALNAYEPEGYSALDEEKKTAIAEKLATAKTEGATAINAADSVENVNLAFESAKAKIDNIVKALTQTAAEAKVDALSQLDEHVASLKSTFAEEDTIIGGLIGTAAETQKSAIEATASAEGATSEQVYEALETAKAAIDQVAADRKATSYNVKYYDGEEEIPVANESKTVKYGATIKKPSVADKEDARLETWLTAGGEEYDFTKAIYAEKDTEIQLYAKWKQADATISFTLDGTAYGNAINAFSGDKFEDYALLVPVANESGKKVSGWQKDGVPLDLTSEIPAGATSLSATTLNEWKTNAELGNGVSSNFAAKDLISEPEYNSGIAEQPYSSAMIANEALYSISTSNFAECSLINFNEGKTKTVENTTIKSAFRSANIVKGTTSKSIFITAKENISLTLIAGLGDSKWSNGRIGGVYYTINGGAETEFAASSDKKLISGKKTISLNAKDIIAIYGKVDASSDGSRLWIFDVEATIANFTNMKVIFNKNSGEPEKIDWNTLKTANDLKELANEKTATSANADESFVGWINGSTEGDIVTDWNTVTLTAGGEINLYPKFQTSNVTINYNVPDGAIGPTSSKAVSGTTLKKPISPTFADHKFKGWFTKDGTDDGDWGSEYTFTETLAEGTLDLYAKFVKLYTVTFNTNGGSSIEPVEVEDGEKATEPTAPTKSGQEFKGWFTDAECTESNNFDFDTAITEAITLYAKWEAKTATVWTFTTGGSSLTNGDITINAGKKSFVAVDAAANSGTITLDNGVSISKCVLVNGGSAAATIENSGTETKTLNIYAAISSNNGSYVGKEVSKGKITVSNATTGSGDYQQTDKEILAITITLAANTTATLTPSDRLVLFAIVYE